VILSRLHPESVRSPAPAVRERRSAVLDLVRALYPQAPHATLCMPFSRAKAKLAGAHYLASTNGARLNAVLGHAADAIEFTYARRGRGESLRNLIMQVAHRNPALSFVPLIESARRDWSRVLALPARGRCYRALLADTAAPLRAASNATRFVPFRPDLDCQAALDLLHACDPEREPRAAALRFEALLAADDFFPAGWFFLERRDSGERVGLAINGYCPEFEEGFVDWIQVRPDDRHRGYGTLLLQESIRRLQHARFITVAGIAPPDEKADLFARCGFTRRRHWTILGQNGTARAPARTAGA